MIEPLGAYWEVHWGMPSKWTLGLQSLFVSLLPACHEGAAFVLVFAPRHDVLLLYHRSKVHS